MVKLETVEDFENIRKLLEDPKSKPHQYRIMEFGYCPDCNEITRCQQSANIEVVSVTCLRCNHNYYRLIGEQATIPYLTYIEIDQMPHWAKTSVNQRHSREFQMKVFQDKLEKFIKKEKAFARKHGNNVRQAAKLR